MIGDILRAAHRLNDRLREMLGRPYHAALGIGLVLETIARARELHEAPATTAGGIALLVLVVLLYLLLLLLQIGELSEHASGGGDALGGTAEDWSPPMRPKISFATACCCRSAEHGR
jgi:hypothetical protein